MKKKVGVIVSVFNEDISQRLKEGALKELKAYRGKLRWVSVPGVVEVALAARWLLQKEEYEGALALGCVIRGQTSHYETCCRMVEQGCLQVQMETNKPLVLSVLTTPDEAVGLARSGGEKGNRGASSARTLLKMLDLKKQLKPPGSLQKGSGPVRGNKPSAPGGFDK